LREVAHSLAVGDLDLSPGADRERTVVALQEFIGVGSWSVESITMRALGEPDAMLASDLGVVSAARALGLASNARSLVQRSAPWRPWRSYAVQYLWSTGDHAINRLPAREEVTTT
jgi:AraC family transcriptional regulator of adaptative response / DNA-3-methyladenine glycosylase II